MRATFHGEAHAVRMQLFAERRFFEYVLESFFLGDIQRSANAFVVGTKTHQTAGECFVRSVPFAGARERTVQFNARLFRRAANKTAREQSQPARAGSVTAARAD